MIRLLRWVESNPGASGFLSIGAPRGERLVQAVTALMGEDVELYIVPDDALVGADPLTWIMIARESWRRL